ncbi:Na+/H+ antiporter NhaC [Alteromonas lipolytica]|uniref:Na+/H+ antiporter NhaC n=1 Tax=Alteromonas lipolytica TaxID=1856405 RepID=A0A1E8F9B0_9ALTE|nr:Na+/H+ antiporter NhaC [Alteromonas lipolytica]OFI32188.1 Na+/H+ antiporter NhaC [Alteromonas lipolytica]GGF83172.1 Na+/H+ antiporter NhaC [Alteromonas lipolytica]
MSEQAKRPFDKPQPVWLAALPLLVLLAVFCAGALFTELGGTLVVVAILLAALVAGGIGFSRGIRWQQMEASAVAKFGDVFPVVLILLSIGGLIGSWMLCGTIPFFVWLGIYLIDPGYLYVSAFLAAALMSIFTGSSWASAGTIGVALMGLATVMDASLAITAGAVISGACFGDKMSPLSDSTNISAIAAQANLYEHIGHMVYTALPSFLLALLVFLLVPLSPTGAQNDAIAATAAMQALIEDAFAPAWWQLLPPALVILAITQKWPPVLGITYSTLLALILAVAFRPFSLDDAVMAYLHGFSVDMLPTAIQLKAQANEAFLQLVERGGLYSMVGTLVVIIAAFLLAGAMQASGGLNVLIQAMLKQVKGVFSLILSTMLSGVTLLSLTSHGGVTSLIVGNLYQQAYQAKRLAPVNLSRSIEDSVTLMDPVLPWTVSGLFMASTLGVATIDYMPWALFCWGGPLFSLMLAAFFSQTRAIRAARQIN